MAKKTTAEFIADARKVHGDRYDYSLVEYMNNSSKVEIICNDHGMFYQRPGCHLRGISCPKCGYAKKATSSRTSKEYFLEKAYLVHKDRYNYSQVDYKGCTKRVVIICKQHGEFSQTPSQHYKGKGCPTCAGVVPLRTEDFVARANKVHNNKYKYLFAEYISAKHKVLITCTEHGAFKQRASHHLSGVGCPKCGGTEKFTASDFIKKAIETHGNRYDYSLADYKNIKTSVEIICKDHGVFKQSPDAHLKGSRCPACSGRPKVSTSEFVRRSKALHGEKFDYSLAKYINTKHSVKIICKEHGGFNQSPLNHYQGQGCPKCKNSKGETSITNYLIRTGICYETQKRFEDCKDKRPLPFDFFIPSYNILIEYDGEQHYIPRKTFGGGKALKATQRRDSIKTSFAEKHGYKLLRIPYTDYDRIEEILAEHLQLGKVVQMEQPQQLKLAI